MMIPETAKKNGYYVDLAPAAKFYSKPGTETITYDTPKWNTASSPYAANSTTILDFFRQADAERRLRQHRVPWREATRR